MSMLAAAITTELTGAGLPAGAVHHWFVTGRRQLAGLAPRDALELPGSGATVLALARHDVHRGGCAATTPNGKDHRA